MHAPHSVKRKKQIDASWEQEIRDLQMSCLKTKRQAPTRLRCCVKECGAGFEGTNAWDERMEHVGKHLERVAAAGERDVGSIVDQGRDRYLVEWALKEGIIEVRGGGGVGYRLCVGGKKGDEGDEDADGEEE